MDNQRKREEDSKDRVWPSFGYLSIEGGEKTVIFDINPLFLVFSPFHTETEKHLFV